MAADPGTTGLQRLLARREVDTLLARFASLQAQGGSDQ